MFIWCFRAWLFYISDNLNYPELFWIFLNNDANQLIRMHSKDKRIGLDFNLIRGVK